MYAALEYHSGLDAHAFVQSQIWYLENRTKWFRSARRKELVASFGGSRTEGGTRRSGTVGG